MDDIYKAFCRQLAQARRVKGLTQSALAEAVGCKQSALSMLEAGHTAKVSQETVEKIAALLDVPLEKTARHDARPDRQSATASTHAYCPHADCFSNVPYVVNGELHFWPRPETGAWRRPHTAGLRRVVGTPLPALRSCGDNDWRLLSHVRWRTGCQYTAARDDYESWAAQRRPDIAEWRSLIL